MLIFVLILAVGLIASLAWLYALGAQFAVLKTQVTAMQSKIDGVESNVIIRARAAISGAIARARADADSHVTHARPVVHVVINRLEKEINGVL